MKSYCVDVDFTISKSFSIEANSEEEAMKLIKEKLDKYPYDYQGGHYVCHDVYDAYEED